jgi:hypothetical protein
VRAYAVNLVLRRETRRRLSRWWAAPAATMGGLVGARIPDPDAQRATSSQAVILNLGLRVVAFALAGILVSTTPWLAVTALLPVAWAGVWVVIALTFVWRPPPQRASSPPFSSQARR